MAISFTNIWKTKILDPVKSFLDAEFKGTIPVYYGEYKPTGSMGLRLVPASSELVEHSKSFETREYQLNIRFYFNERNIRKDTTDHILRYVSRIEALFHDNLNKDDSSGDHLYIDGRLVDCTLDVAVKDEEDFAGYIVEWEWNGYHVGNIS